MENQSYIKYRPDIDGLRAVAVLFVIVFHAFPTVLAGGFIGVDIFFVISGYLISGIILKAIEDNQFSYLGFYRRRIKRIFPALIVVLTACLIFGWFFLFSGEYLSLGKDIASGAGFISNIIYWFESGYFDISSSLKPLLHLWSLGVEEQFYIFWPIILVFIYKIIKKVPEMISVLLVLSFSLSIYIGLNNLVTAFYLPFTRFWELMAGAFLAYFSLYNGGLLNTVFCKLKIEASIIRMSIVSNILAWTGFILVATSLLVINNSNFYAGIAALPIIAVFLLIESGPEAWVNRKILSNRGLVFIGLISYPLYLWHWPLLSFASIIEAGPVAVWVRCLLIFTAFLLSYATYGLIEKPLRNTKIKNIS